MLLGIHRTSPTDISTTTQLNKPWGEVRYSSAPLPTAYTYTGQYSHTDDFGLMYYNARWYDPLLGRFAQADTMVPGAGNPLAWDRYAYGNNSPVVYRDPSGHCNMYMYENGQCPDGELPTVVTETPDDQQDLSSPPSITENDKSPVNGFFESADYISFSYYKSPTKRLGQLLELASLLLPDANIGLVPAEGLEGLSFGFTITKTDDSLYFAPGASFGKTLVGNSDSSLALVLGWASNGEPDKILEGPSTNHGIGGIFGINYVNIVGSDDYAVEFGFMGPSTTLNIVTASWGIKLK